MKRSNKKNKEGSSVIKHKKRLVFFSCIVFFSFLVITAFVFFQEHGYYQQSTALAQTNLPLQNTTRTTPTYSIKAMMNIHYGPYQQEYLDVYSPIGSQVPEPGIIMIHGGGYGADPEYRSHYTALAKSYASQGYVVANIDYRLINIATPSASYQWPDQVGDIQLAVRRMRQQATSIGLDPTHICSLGDSAGGHFALLLDTLQTIQPSDVSNIASNFSPTVQCVVDQFGPTDLTKLYNENTNPAPNMPRNVLYLLLDNNTPQTNPTLYVNASPVTYVSSQSGQALIIQGIHDSVVLPDQSTEIEAAFQNAGVPVQYVSYNGGHEYSKITPPPSQQDIMTQINAWLQTVEPTK